MGACENYGPVLGPYGTQYVGGPKKYHNFDNQPQDRRSSGAALVGCFHKLGVLVVRAQNDHINIRILPTMMPGIRFYWALEPECEILIYVYVVFLAPSCGRPCNKSPPIGGFPFMY